MEDCRFNPPTNGKKGFHYVIKNGRPHLLTRKDLKDTPKDSIAFKLPSKDGSRKLRMKAQSELIEGLSSGVLPMSWELRPSGTRVPLQWETLLPSRTSLAGGVLVLDTFDAASGFNIWTNTKYDVDGFDIDGFNIDGSPSPDFIRTLRYRTGYYQDFYDPIYLPELQHQRRYVVLDAAGRDSRGFNAFGVNSPVDELWPGEKRGFSENGQFGSDAPVVDASLMLAHDENGFDPYGIHRESRGPWVKRFGQISSQHVGPIWMDAWGRQGLAGAKPACDARGFDLQGTDRNGSRVDYQGFNAYGVHEVTRTLLNERGFSVLDATGTRMGLF